MLKQSVLVSPSKGGARALMTARLEMDIVAYTDPNACIKINGCSGVTELGASPVHGCSGHPDPFVRTGTPLVTGRSNL